jgi:hypothetical protein
MDQINISNLNEEQLKDELKRVRSNCLKASKQNDVFAVAKLTSLAARINRALWDLQTLEENNKK